MPDSIHLRGGHITQDPRLDRVPQADPRNEYFPIRGLIGQPALRPRAWRLLNRLDQGREGACVGFGWAHELAAQPIHVRVSDTDARAIYRRAQQLDEWAGEAYEGTSVLAGAKAVAERGHMLEYRWAFTIDDVLATLARFGPVVIGVNWYEGMFNTDPHGFLHVAGGIAGGHCVVLRGLRREQGRWVVIGRNSWGPGWGVHGDFKLNAHGNGLERLLHEQGDACVPVSRRP